MRARYILGDDADRFWSKVRPNGECLIWTAGCQFRFANGKRCEPWRASWILSHGDPGPGVCIVRTCEDGLCVRVSHLDTLTRSQTAAMANPRQLTDRQIRHVRGIPRYGRELKDAATEFGVSLSTIHYWRYKGRLACA